MFQVNAQNLKDLRAAVEQYGEAWIHGCGNIYVTKEDSHFRAKWSNPLHNGDASAPKYWAHFKSVDEVPDNVEALIKLFEGNRMKQLRDSADKENKNISPVKMLKGTQPAAAPKAPAVGTEELVKAAAHLQEKSMEISGRENILDKKEIELEEKQQEIYAREQQVQELARKKDQELKDHARALAEKEAELAKREKALAKAEK